MTTEDVYTAITRAKDGAFNQWAQRAATLVRRRVDDARAHGAAGQWVDADDRLEELGRELTEGTLAPAREYFTRAAFKLHASTLPLGHPGRDVVPTDRTIETARTTPIGANQVDQAPDLHRVVRRARTELQAHVGRGDSAALQTWAERHKSTITRTAHLHLSDSQIALHEAIGRQVVEQSDGLE